MAMHPRVADNIGLRFSSPHLPPDMAFRDALGIVDVVENDVND
jgi:hypothetical protein